MVEPDRSEANTSDDLPVAIAQVISTEPSPLVVGCQFAHPRQPPLSIIHLLVWMVTTGLFLGLGRVAISTWENAEVDVPSWYRMLFQVEQVLTAPLCGAALFSLLLMIWRLVRRGPHFPSQPGHWLMVIYGFTIACTWGFGIATAVWVPANWDVRIPAYFFDWLQYALGYLIGGIVCCVAGWRLRDQWYWKLDFKVCGLLQLTSAAILLLLVAGGEFVWWTGRVWITRFGMFEAFSFAVILVVMVIYEVRRGDARDWLHWVGVALGLLVPAVSFLDQLAQRMFARM